MKSAPHRIIPSALALAVAAGFLLPSPARGQLSEKEAADLAVKHHQALAANRAVLLKYSSNYRIELWKKDELQWIDLVNVVMGADSLPVFTQVNRETVDEKGVIFRKRQTEKAFEKQDAIVEYALKWTLYYSHMPADRLHTLFSKAAQNKSIAASPESSAVIGVSASNVRDSDANDTVSLWLNKENGHPIRFSFTAPVERTVEGYEGDTISATINYRYLENGKAFYPDHIDVVIPAKHIQLKFENLNVEKRN